MRRLHCPLEAAKVVIKMIPMALRDSHRCIVRRHQAIRGKSKSIAPGATVAACECLFGAWGGSQFAKTVHPMTP